MNAVGRHLPRLVLGLVLGARRALLHRGRTRGARRRHRGSPSRRAPPVTWTEEQTYFFRLSAYADRLLAHYEAHPEFIGPDVRRNEVVSFVSGGLRDLSISRTTFDWGVQVPGHPDHVMYVWVDALTNYLTGAGFPDTDSEAFRTLLARRSAHDRQGHHPVPHRVLARVPDVGRDRAAAPGLRARLHQRQGREDEQVGRQRRRPRRARRRVRRSTRCATSCCARCRSARTAATARTRSSAGSTPTWPTNWAISPSGRCRW